MVLFLYNARIGYHCIPEQEALLRKVIFISFLLTFSLLSAVQPVYSFSHKAIAAKAWIVIDENDSVLSSKYPSVKLPPASTVKLVTAMVALDNLDPAAKVIVSNKARAARSGKPRLIANDEFTVSDLLHLALMRSTTPRQ